MVRPENLIVPEGKENVIAAANRETRTVKQKISLLVSDGSSFPALTEIHRLLALPDPNRVFQDLATATAKAKISELTDLLTELESSCANLAALILALGEGLNNKETLDEVVNDINTSCETYAGKTRTALCALAAASGGPPSGPAPTPRPESNKFSKISATAEPSQLPRDISPADFHQ